MDINPIGREISGPMPSAELATCPDVGYVGDPFVGPDQAALEQMLATFEPAPQAR